MSFHQLRRANEARQQEWQGEENCDLMFRAVEFCGEAGELANAVKKFERFNRGIGGNERTEKLPHLLLRDIAHEVGDVLITLDLLCMELNIDLDRAWSHKFDDTSTRHNLKTRSNHDEARGFYK